MAIQDPEQMGDFCEGTSGARFEWQTPDRDILFDEQEIAKAIQEYLEAAQEAQDGTDAAGQPINPPSPAKLQELMESRYPWDGVTIEGSNNLPVRFATQETVTTLVEQISITPGSTSTTVATLTKNKYYTFVTSGVVNLTANTFYDALYFGDITGGSTATEPSNRLTIDDPQFQNVYFNAGRASEYNPLHIYSVGYVGNDSTVTFTLANEGTGTISVDIYENEYRLLIQKEFEDETPPIVFYDQTRDKPFINLNIACGGSCPTRTSFSCECIGTRSCYWDDKTGNIAKIFEGNKNG